MLVAFACGSDILSTLRLSRCVCERWVWRRFSCQWMNAIGGFQKCACEDCTSLNWSFVENRDTLRIRRSFTTRTSNCREQTRWFSRVRLWGLYFIEQIFAENRDTLRIRKSFITRTSNCREQTRWFSKVRSWGLYLVEQIFVENRDKLRIKRSFTSRTSNCREPTRWLSKVRLWRFYLTELIFCRKSWHTPY